jgi:4-oxalocrotonate tautomerase family enzyme
MDSNELGKAQTQRSASHEVSRRAVLKTTSMAAGMTMSVGALSEPSPTRAQTAPSAGFGAPLIELHIPAGILSAEQKRAMIKGVSDVVVNALKWPDLDRKYLWVQILEVPSGGWGVAGEVFTPRQLR